MVVLGLAVVGCAISGGVPSGVALLGLTSYAIKMQNMLNTGNFLLLI